MASDAAVLPDEKRGENPAGDAGETDAPKGHDVPDKTDAGDAAGAGGGHARVEGEHGRVPWGAVRIALVEGAAPSTSVRR